MRPVRVEVQAIERSYRWAPRVVVVCHDLDTGERHECFAAIPRPGRALTPPMKLYRLWILALGRRPTRADRPLNLRGLIGKTFDGTARTVTHDKAGNPHAEPYSVVELGATTQTAEQWTDHALAAILAPLGVTR